MAINYAEKYADKIDEKFSQGSFSNSAVNSDYEFIGVETVKVYSVPTVKLNDYKTTGSNRYGDPKELENEVQELTLTQDKSFTFTIDRKSRDDAQMAMEAGKALAREIEQEVIPEVDRYRFAKISKNAAFSLKSELTSSNAYELFLSVQEGLDDLEAPTDGRIAYCDAKFYKKIKLDESFTKKGDMATQLSMKGIIGEIDGVPLVKMPKSRFPEGVHLIITNPIATTAPVKLENYIIHEDPPGISGWLVEGRVRHDAFVLNNKKKAIGILADEDKETTLENDGTAA